MGKAATEAPPRAPARWRHGNSGRRHHPHRPTGSLAADPCVAIGQDRRLVPSRTPQHRGLAGYPPTRPRFLTSLRGGRPAADAPGRLSRCRRCSSAWRWVAAEAPPARRHASPRGRHCQTAGERNECGGVLRSGTGRRIRFRLPPPRPPARVRASRPVTPAVYRGRPTTPLLPSSHARRRGRPRRPRGTARPPTTATGKRRVAALMPDGVASGVTPRAPPRPARFEAPPRPPSPAGDPTPSDRWKPVWETAPRRRPIPFPRRTASGRPKENPDGEGPASARHWHHLGGGERPRGGRVVTPVPLSAAGKPPPL